MEMWITGEPIPALIGPPNPNPLKNDDLPEYHTSSRRHGVELWRSVAPDRCVAGRVECKIYIVLLTAVVSERANNSTLM